jgi:hypothetical protein
MRQEGEVNTLFVAEGRVLEMTRRKQAISIQSLVNTWTGSRAAAYFVLG